jgi:hypothetical protein
MRLPAAGAADAVGLFLEHADGSGTAVRVGAGGVAELGPMRADGTGFKAEKPVDREWRFGASARFRLLLKDTLIEFYLDDLLIECYSLPQPVTGRVGLIGGEAEGVFGPVRAWRCGG